MSENLFFKPSDYIGYHDSEGHLVLPKEWNEGGFTLDNTPLKDIRKGDKIKLREVTELGSYANRERVKSY